MKITIRSLGRPLGWIAALASLLAAAPSSGTSKATVANTAVDAPTYAGEVAQVLNENCVACHRPGQIGPMSLRSYEEARPWAKSIGREIQAGTMPPWHAESEHLAFANDRRLDPSARDTLLRWVAAGAPAGDLANAPEPPEFPQGVWRLGEPDLIVTFEEVTIPAGGPDQFRDLIGKVALPEDKWIEAVEILPGNSKVVHHVITLAVKGFDFDPEGGWLGAWAAGTEPMVFPKGTGRLLEKGANLIADMHYHPAETEEKDVTRIGLHFAEPEEVERALANLWIINEGFEIPAGASNHEVRASRTFWQDGKIHGLIPHMHYRGKDFTFYAHHPDGTTKTLMTVPRWDFNWQTVYTLDEPFEVTAGTRIECVAHYDNSAGNPVNPDPSINVTFGDESYDEMMIGFIDFVAKDSLWPKSSFQIRGEKVSELAAAHPGQVWKVSGRKPEDRDTPEAWAPLIVPREGDGQFWIIWNNQLDATPVQDIVWSGDEFAAKLASPFGKFDFRGKVEGDEIEVVIVQPNGNESVWDGKLTGDA